MANKTIDVDLKKEIIDLIKGVQDSGYYAISLSGLKEKLSAQNIEFTHEELGITINNLLLERGILLTNIQLTVTGGIGDIDIALD